MNYDIMEKSLYFILRNMKNPLIYNKNKILIIITINKAVIILCNNVALHKISNPSYTLDLYIYNKIGLIENHI